MSHSALRLRLRPTLTTLAALRHCPAPLPLLYPSISSPLSSQSTSFSLTSIVKSRLFTTYEKFSLSSFSELSDLFKGMDYCHWVIYMDMDMQDERDGSNLPGEKMLRFYEETCAEALNISLKEAKQRIYGCTTASFQVVMTEKEAEKFRGFDQILLMVPDFYIDPERNDYGGGKYINGRIITENSCTLDFLKKLRSTVDFLNKLKDVTGNEDYIKYCWDKFFYCFSFHMAEMWSADSQIVQIGLDVLRVYKDERGCSPEETCLKFLLNPCVGAKDLKGFILIWEEMDNAGFFHDHSDYIKMHDIFVAYEDRQSAIKMLREIRKENPFIEMLIERYNSEYSSPRWYYSVKMTRELHLN